MSGHDVEVTQPGFLVLLVDDDDATLLVSCADAEEAHGLAAAATMTDGDVSAYAVAVSAATDVEFIRDLLREGFNVGHIIDAREARDQRAHDDDGKALAVVAVDHGQAVCPHCGAVDDFAEVDIAQRVNRGSLSVQDDRIVSAQWGRGEQDFRHLGYQCYVCGRPVQLPDSIDETAHG